MSDVKTLIDLAVMFATPVFAAGGAWVSIKYLREDVRELKRDVRRLGARVVNLYARVKVPLPADSEESTLR